MGYDMMTTDIATSTGGGVDWIFIGVIAACIVLGAVVGFFIGRRVMKKKDI